ncbi:MAG: copper-binding protein [Deltaproteobacteria bacterium]|nr:copper-binding protein [Deltaproteobacteria bacterium]
MKKLFASCQYVLLGIVLGAGSLAALEGPDPADPGAPAPEIKYWSAFSDYRPYQEQEPLSWKQINEDVAGIPGAAGHAGHESHGGAATAGTEAASSPAGPTAQPDGAIAATGVIRRIDRADAKVVIAHEPIASLGWPAMTMLFRLKDPASVDPYKEGDRVDFTLEKSASDYVISGFRKSAGHEWHDTGKGDKK